MVRFGFVVPTVKKDGGCGDYGGHADWGSCANDTSHGRPSTVPQTA